MTRITGPIMKLILLSAAIVAVVGCNNSGCNDNRSSIPIAEFYSSSEKKAIALDSIEVGGINAPNDSLLLSSGTTASQVYLPLRANQPDIAFYIAYRYKALAAYNLSDEITISYTTIPYFASEECGAMYRYRITAIDHTSALLDSVAVVAPDSIITNLNVASLRLYFRTE